MYNNKEIFRGITTTIVDILTEMGVFNIVFNDDIDEGEIQFHTKTETIDIDHIDEVIRITSTRRVVNVYPDIWKDSSNKLPKINDMLILDDGTDVKTQIRAALLPFLLEDRFEPEIQVLDNHNKNDILTAIFLKHKKEGRLDQSETTNKAISNVKTIKTAHSYHKRKEYIL